MYRIMTNAAGGRKPVPRLLFFAVVAVSLALLAVACGGSSDSSVPVSSPEATAAPSSPEAATVPPAATAPEATAAPEVTKAAKPAAGKPAEAASEPVAAAKTPEPEPTAAPEPTATIAPEPTATVRPPAAANTPEPPAAAAPADTPLPPAPTAAPTEPPPPPPPCEGTTGGKVGNCAPEFAGTQEWINSGPLSMEELRGKVVLIDFWTYSCINCIRTLPYLRTWYERYADDGLVIVGVHTPEFHFEKVYENVVQATKDDEVTWPVVQDNDFAVWQSYENRFWPAKYLIDKDGVVRYTHFGEGKYGETESEIRKLLEEVGADASIESASLPEDQEYDSTFLGKGAMTRELFAGWRFTALQQRGGIGQVDEYLEAARASYEMDDYLAVVAEFPPPGSLDPNLIYFHGPWAIGPESARHAEATGHFDDYLALVYSARSVNAVLTSDSGESYKVRITHNGDYLTEANRGDDIIIGEDGESYLIVSEPKLYKIIENPTWMGEQELRMASMSDDFGLFSFTFGVYEDGY